MWNLSDLDVTSVLPANTYQAFPKAVEWKEWQGKKTLDIRFEILGPDRKGSGIFHTLYLYDEDQERRKKAFKHLKRLFIACDLDVSQINPDMIPQQLMRAKPINIKVGIYETDQGQQKNSVIFYDKLESEKNSQAAAQLSAAQAVANTNFPPSDSNFSADKIPF